MSHPDKGPPPEVTVTTKQICPPEDNGLVVIPVVSRPSALHPARPSPLLVLCTCPITGPFARQRRKVVAKGYGVGSQGTIDITKAGNAMPH